MSSIFESLKNKVSEYLYDLPYDIYIEEHDISLENSLYELCDPRDINLEEEEYLSRRIGLANLTLARNYVINECISLDTEKKFPEQYYEDVWQNILNFLERKKIIRQFPHIKQSNLRVIE